MMFSSCIGEYDDGKYDYTSLLKPQIFELPKKKLGKETCLFRNVFYYRYYDNLSTGEEIVFDKIGYNNVSSVELYHYFEDEFIEFKKLYENGAGFFVQDVCNFQSILMEFEDILESLSNKNCICIS